MRSPFERTFMAICILAGMQPQTLSTLCECFPMKSSYSAPSTRPPAFPLHLLTLLNGAIWKGKREQGMRVGTVLHRPSTQARTGARDSAVVIKTPPITVTISIRTIERASCIVAG